jgi:hypothetical protein
MALRESRRLWAVSLSSAQEKAYQVLHSLGASEGTLAERIEDAFFPAFTNLAHEARERTGGLDDGLMVDIVGLSNELTSREALLEEGRLRATLDALDELEMIDLASRMVTLCIETMQARGDDAWLLGDRR